MSSSRKSPLDGISNGSSYFDGSVNNDSDQSGSIATEKNVGLTEGSSPLSNSQKMHS